METVCLRYSNAYGEGHPTEGAYCNVMGIFEQQKQRGEKLTIVGDGEQRRDFIYIDDFMDFIDKSILNQSNLYGLYNCGMGYSITINELIAL